jgi:NAD+ diphosphatase
LLFFEFKFLEKTIHFFFYYSYFFFSISGYSLMNYCPICASALKSKEIDQMLRLVCGSESCNFIHWNNPVPVVAAIVEWKGDIILARNAAWPEGMFGLITGFLEKGESPEEGVIREVKEELSLDTTECTFVGNYSFAQANQLIIAFHVKTEGRVFRSEELAELKAVPPAELVPWHVGTGPAVKDWLNKFYKPT